MEILYILIAVFLVSLTAFAGIFTLSFQENTLKKIIPFLIALSTGAMLGGFFIHLLPKLNLQAVKNGIDFSILSAWILFGIFFFYFTEKIFHWHHHHSLSEVENCHTCQEKKIKPVGYMILFSDGIHNFLDGVAIASAFHLGTEAGIITTILVLLHELPQEIGDFGVLLNSGFEKIKALWFNFLSGLTSVLGAILTFFAIQYIHGIEIYLTAIAGGSFIYIALVDLMPELHNHQHENKKCFSKEIFFILLGIFLMWVVKFIAHNVK